MVKRHEGNEVERVILDATLQTISQHKISGTRMRQIAEKAGMSQGNLHYYFPTKADLFVALLDDMLETFASERQCDLQDPQLSAAQKLRRIFEQKKTFILQRIEFMDAYYDFWVQATKAPHIRAKMQEAYNIWRRDVRAVIDEGVTAGQFSSTGAELAESLIVSLMEGAALQHIIDPVVFNLDDYFRSALDAVLRRLEADSRSFEDVGLTVPGEW